VRWLARTETDTEALGARLAATRPAGSELVVVFLDGELGAGKTTLARGFLQSLGVSGPVRSPTYTLVESYALTDVTAVHADLYRLREPRELVELGLRDYAAARHLWLVEWPDRGAGFLPRPDLRVSLAAAVAAHPIEVIPASALGEQWVARLGEG
jgi:tRNA threonylcarbamoyladenosine biosynthesis protein TsaE